MVAACLVRELFGSILYHSLQQNINMAEALKYSLTPVPPSLSHVDGTMQTTPKATLMNQSQKLQRPLHRQFIPPSLMPHFSYICRRGLPLSSSFAAVARSLLQKVMYAKGDVIHFVTDKWLFPSIKDWDRDSRTSSSTAFNITGPSQKCPSNLNQALRNNHFLVDTSEDGSLARIFKQKTLFAHSGNVCYNYKVVDGRVQRKVDDRLHNDHEDADCRMFDHLAKTTDQNNVVIRTSDTDSLIIALGCYQFLDQSL